MDEDVMIDDYEPQGSIIPPGQVDLALFLAQLPQVSPYDCGVELDQLTMSGANHIAHETGKTVNDVAKDALWMYLRMYFARTEPVEEEGLADENEERE